MKEDESSRNDRETSIPEPENVGAEEVLFTNGHSLPPMISNHATVSFQKITT